MNDELQYGTVLNPAYRTGRRSLSDAELRSTNLTDLGDDLLCLKMPETDGT